jgi:dolichyl-phosphate-mannose-protein mannosyltransferase
LFRLSHTKISRVPPVAFVLMLSLGLNTLGLTWGLPNYVDWAQDSIVLQTLGAIAKRFSNGWFDKYPPVQYVVLACFYTPYIGYLFLSGGLQTPTNVFPYGFADPLSALTSLILIARVVSVLMGAAIILLVYMAVNELFDRRAAIFSALLVAICYPFVYYAHNANVDVPYLFWALLAIIYFLKLLKYGQLKFYVLFAFFAALSICTKDQAYGLFILSPIPILWVRFRETTEVAQRAPGFARMLFDSRLLIAGAVAIATFIIAHNIPFNFAGFLGHIQRITGEGVEPYVSYAPTLSGRLQLLLATGSALAESLTPPIFWLCIFGTAFCVARFPRFTLPLLFLGFAYYFTFINVVRFMRLRFVLPLSIILTFFGGQLLAEIWYTGGWLKVRRLAVCVLLVYAALFPIQLDLLLMGGESRYAAEAWMEKNFRKSSIVETFATSHYHLAWFYPRFPSHVKLRVSERVTGSEWISQKLPANRVRFPNLYDGTEAPDYIVLKFLPRAFDRQQEGVLSELYRGDLGYKLVASFNTQTFVSIEGLTINPRVDIFEKAP